MPCNKVISNAELENVSPREKTGGVFGEELSVESVFFELERVSCEDVTGVCAILKVWES